MIKYNRIFYHILLFMELLKELIKNKKIKIIIRVFYTSIIVILVWLIIGLNYWIQSWEKTEYKNNLVIEKGDLKDPIVLWESKTISWKKAKLNFSESWNIKKIYKNEWDDILIWEKITELDNDILKLKLDKINIALRKNYKNLY